MLDLIVAMGIGLTLLITQCSKSKKANKNGKSSRRSSEKPGQQLVQESQMGGVEPANNGGENGGEGGQQQSKRGKSKRSVEPKGKSSRDERNADGGGGGGGEDQDGGEKERQKTKTSKSKQSNKKTSEAQGPSSSKPSKPMDGTQNQTDAQKTSNCEPERGAPLNADECEGMEETVYEFQNPVCNDLAKLNRTTEAVTEVQFKGNIDDDILNQEMTNLLICQKVAEAWPNKKERAVNRLKNRTNAPEAGKKMKPVEKSITEKSEESEVPGRRVKVNNKKSVLYETKEQVTEDPDPEEVKEGEGEKKV